MVSVASDIPLYHPKITTTWVEALTILLQCFGVMSKADGSSNALALLNSNSGSLES